MQIGQKKSDITNVKQVRQKKGKDTPKALKSEKIKFDSYLWLLLFLRHFFAA